MRFILPTIRVSLLVSRVRVDPRRMSFPPLFTRDGERGAVDHLFQSNASTPTAWEGGNVTALRASCSWRAGPGAGLRLGAED